MNHLRHQKYKNKRLEKNLNTIKISINDMDKFEKKLRKKNIYKKHYFINTLKNPLTIFLNL